MYGDDESHNSNATYLLRKACSERTLLLLPNEGERTNEYMKIFAGTAIVETGVRIIIIVHPWYSCNIFGIFWFKNTRQAQKNPPKSATLRLENAKVVKPAIALSVATARFSKRGPNAGCSAANHSAKKILKFEGTQPCWAEKIFHYFWIPTSQSTTNLKKSKTAQELRFSFYKKKKKNSNKPKIPY